MLKITDDTTVSHPITYNAVATSFLDFLQCLKYKSRSSIILGRFDALTLSLTRKMQNHTPAPVTEAPIVSPSSDSTREAPVASPTAPKPSAAPSAADAGVKKKKPKKKGK